jgi:glycosyltransferase involved in cell wall biosynthesis
VGIKVALDASRVRSGGGVAHLLGILDIANPLAFGIDEIHVWAYQKLLDMLPSHTWLIKHNPPELERSLLSQSWWQATKLSEAVERTGCEILFSADASTFCQFKPMVVLNQNMLAYDPGVLALFGWGKDRVQQTLMYFVQRRAFQSAAGSIFLTQHAAHQVQRRVGQLDNISCIPHGVSEKFKCTPLRSSWPQQGERPIRCLYVSPVFEYKHQVEVCLAINLLREQGEDIELILAGGGGRRALRALRKLLAKIDPEEHFVKLMEFIPNDSIASLMVEADVFVFASSCETFGIALLEAMAVGLPIVCSARSSLPETLQDAGIYCDPQDYKSIAQAIAVLINDVDKRHAIASRAKALSAGYSWLRCAQETWQFIAHTHQTASGKKTV